LENLACDLFYFRELTIRIINFNLTDPEEQKKCFHWTNIRPLIKKDNLSKGTKVPEKEELNKRSQTIDEFISPIFIKLTL